jgi:ATP-binding protein involved in chromosome partitioning
MDGMPSREEILKALEAVIDPELRRSIVELEMVRSIDSADGLVRVTVSLTTPGCPIRSHFENAVRTAVGALDGVTRVDVAFDVLSDQEKAGLQQKLGRGALPEGALARSRTSCASARARAAWQVDDHRQPRRGAATQGKKVGVLDADVWGYSIPRMFDVGGRPQVSPDRKILRSRLRREDHVDRLLRRGGLRRRLARADAPQGAHAVPRGRRLGRARLPARRPAARAPATSR